MDINGISVIISTYDDPINLVSQCIDSLLPQEKIQEIIVVDSSKKDDIKKFCYSLNNDKINYIYTSPKGLSDARNKGIKIAKNRIVVFTDSDCIADNDWAKNICNSFSKNVAIIGGKILPKWYIRPNKILSKSIIAQGYYSLFDLGEEMIEVDQIYGGNFAVDLNLLSDQVFLSKLGRRKENLISGEETELCRQLKKDKL